jgi:hypothetical protein
MSSIDGATAGTGAGTRRGVDLRGEGRRGAARLAGRLAGRFAGRFAARRADLRAPPFLDTVLLLDLRDFALVFDFVRRFFAMRAPSKLNARVF